MEKSNIEDDAVVLGFIRLLLEYEAVYVDLQSQRICIFVAVQFLFYYVDLI